ncbi:MAG: replicative DNA helicase [Rickettsiales bacterium]|nr:MAG: replicative DNA helicase [Rickettsiales bacterium]
MSKPEGIITEDSLTRTLPANFRAEQMLLGAVLINSDLTEQVNEFLKAEHFHEPLHQKIYKGIETLIEKGLSATPITVKSMLGNDPLYIEAKGDEYLIKLTTIAMVVINPRDYGKIIYELAIKRHLIAIGEDIVNDSYNSTLEQTASEQLEQAEGKLYQLASEGMVDKGFAPLKDSVADSMASINRAMKNSEHITGISTGLIDLDTMLSGFHKSDLVIIAGRPSMGKTAFAINFALNACKALRRRTKEGEKPPSVGFFSLEMSSEQLAARLLSMMARVDSTNLRNGMVSEEHYNDLRKASAELSEMPFFIDDTPALSIASVRAKARKLKRKNNLGIIFIDYLQLLRGTGKSDNRVLEISEITQGLKAIAKELDIPVIALSQLSRAVEQRPDKRPMLSDLRESGSIEQDADVVMFLYREEYYLKRSEPPSSDPKYAAWQENLDKFHNIAEILIAKHRNGAVGNVRLHYLEQFSSIGNLDKARMQNF